MATQLILLFIDGLGLGEDNPNLNPLASPLITLGSQCRLVGHEECRSSVATVVPTDACLGVSGTPQSATGQTALLSGINAPQLLGYHKSAYPNEALKEILCQHSIFARCRQLGYRATFANGFRKEYWDLIRRRKRRHSVTTTAVLCADVALRYEKDYLKGRAVYHDITGRFLRTMARPLPYLAPQEAGRRLAALAGTHEFVLFEYFMTDVLGHRRHWEEMRSCLSELQLFIEAMLDALDLNRTAVILASDHGNIEDLGTSGHTTNPVPTILYGPMAQAYAPRIHDLTDIVPVILDLLKN